MMPSMRSRSVSSLNSEEEAWGTRESEECSTVAFFLPLSLPRIESGVRVMPVVPEDELEGEGACRYWSMHGTGGAGSSYVGASERSRLRERFVFMMWKMLREDLDLRGSRPGDCWSTYVNELLGL